MKPFFKCFVKIIIFLLCFSYNFNRSVCVAANVTYVPLDNIALDCGSSDSQISFFDGRNWTGDANSKFVSFSSHNNSTASIANSMDPGVPQIPYKSARLFFSKFSYTFNVTPGPKFVRLHFYPTAYSGFDASKAFLSVTDGYHTLLSNFSASLAANDKNFNTVFKEFIIHVQNHSLRLTFSPSSNDSDAFAFVNGIEVVSMPLHLYAGGENVPVPFIGYPEVVVTLDHTTALETSYRINVDGDDISPKSDSGMFRTWRRDDQYIFGSAFGQDAYDYDLSVRYTPTVPAYTAPELVYQTARFMGTNARINLNYNLSWFFPVETGFMYLVRLHFCELDRNITKINQKVFSVFINNQTAEDQADVIAWSGGQGVPVYKDYVTIIPEVRERIQDLWLELHPNTETKPQYYNAFLNGVEIFKLNNHNGNLAGFNPPQPPGLQVNPSFSKSSVSSKKKLVMVSLGGVVILAFLVLCVIAFWIRAIRERTKKKKHTSKRNSLCRCFTMKEIKAATNNFNEAKIIGNGGFGVVYKGYIDGGANIVAIKRGNQVHDCGEFQAEIRTLSLLRHKNVVSLLGYCNDEGEMILVYEYMPNGTLFDHLHHFDNKQHKMPLSWIQRLQICAGAAQGLCYLHTGMKHQIVHRDVKTSNILLDENWVAKIADFGLSKIDPAIGSTKVKGSIGYLDPEYCRLYKLTDKSDVYSFGVVLLEVLSSKFVVNPAVLEDCNYNDKDEDDAVSFVEWALNCYEKGDWDKLIDPHLEGKFEAASLKKFMEIAKKCLAERGMDRPPMSEVLWNIELAIQLEICDHEQSEDKDMIIGWVGNSDLTPGVEFSEMMNPVGR